MGIRSQSERQRPEGRKLSADNATRMRATCWPDKLMACCAVQTMINHVAKSVQIMRNGLEIDKRDLAQLCSTSNNGKEEEV